MSETAEDTVNRILRDHEGYTGDGQGGNGALPVGDRSTAVKPIVKRDLREALVAPLQETFDARDVALQAQSDAEDARDLAQQAAGSVQFPVSYAPGQGLNPTQQQQARDNIGLGTAATVDHGTDPGEVPLNSDLGSMAVEDAGDYVAVADKATPAEAQAGVYDTKWMTPSTTKDAIQALAPVFMSSASATQATLSSGGSTTPTKRRPSLNTAIYLIVESTGYDGDVYVNPSSSGSGYFVGKAPTGGATSVFLPAGWYYWVVPPSATSRNFKVTYIKET